MTTVDHQQAAEYAAAEKIIDAVTAFVRDHKPISGGQVTKEALTAAAPHLRAETVDRLKNFRNDYQHTYAIPGDPYADGYLTACNAIIALLEGGGE